MTSLNQAAARVNRYDVVSVTGTAGKIKEVLARDLTMSQAIKLQTEKNTPLGPEIAVVLPSGSYEAPECGSDASSEPDDSEATAAPERASGAKSRVVVMTGDGKKHLLRPMSRDEAEQLAEVCRGAQQVDIVEDDSEPELFDVVAIDGLGIAGPECLSKSVRLEAAVASALGWNEAANTNTVAIVVPAETVPTSQPASQPQEDRGYKIADVAYDARAAAFRQAFSQHLEQLGKSVDLIEDACCVGIVAKSLKDLAMDLGDFEDAFLEGFHGGVDAPELISALGWDD